MLADRVLVFLVILSQSGGDALRVRDDGDASAVVWECDGGHDDGAAEAFDLREGGVDVIYGDVGHPAGRFCGAVRADGVADAAKHFVAASENVVAGHRFALALPASDGCVEGQRVCRAGSGEFRPAEVAVCVAVLSHGDECFVFLNAAC